MTHAIYHHQEYNCNETKFISLDHCFFGKKNCSGIGNFKISFRDDRHCTALYCKLNRIIESLKLEGTFEGHLVSLPCNEQGHHS